jgi:hypothetical protein
MCRYVKEGALHNHNLSHNWQQLRDRWEAFHVVRVLLSIAGLEQSFNDLNESLKRRTEAQVLWKWRSAMLHPVSIEQAMKGVDKLFLFDAVTLQEDEATNEGEAACSKRNWSTRPFHPTTLTALSK